LIFYNNFNKDFTSRAKHLQKCILASFFLVFFATRVKHLQKYIFAQHLLAKLTFCLQNVKKRFAKKKKIQHFCTAPSDEASFLKS
jgi:hypothetical protein